MSHLEQLFDLGFKAHFHGPLTDFRDVANVGPPGEAPQFVRVCDIAVQVLDRLGCKLSFDATFPERWSSEQLAEAAEAVAKLTMEPH